MFDLMTMKSARASREDTQAKKLEETFEIFPELIAQWLITGKVTMNVIKPRSVKLVEMLNRLIQTLLSRAVGKLLVTV
jgi:hypothetical protein